MAKETKQEKEERLAREQAAAELALAEFYKGVPARLVMMQAIAHEVGVSCTVQLTDTGPEVVFEKSEYDSRTDRETTIIDQTVRYDSDQWHIEYVEDQLNSMKAEQDSALARRKMAQDHFDTLSKELKAALKENIHWMKS
jgi:hypothetical protein